MYTPGTLSTALSNLDEQKTKKKKHPSLNLITAIHISISFGYLGSKQNIDLIAFHSSFLFFNSRFFSLSSSALPPFLPSLLTSILNYLNT